MKPSRIVILVAIGLVAVSIIPHGAVSAKSDGEVQSSAKVSNEKPANVRLMSAGDADPNTPGEQVSPTPDRPTSVTLVFQAEDGNGWKDLTDASFQVFRPDGSAYTDPITATASNQGNGKRRDFSASFSMQHNDAPGTYSVTFRVVDRNGDDATGQGSFQYMEMLALAVDASSVSFGAGGLGPGTSTHDQSVAVPVRNAGNVMLDLHLAATPLSTSSGDASIAPHYLKYSRIADMTGEVGMSESGWIDKGFGLAPGPEAKYGYFDIHVPTGEEQYIPADTYAGRITIGAVVG